MEMEAAAKFVQVLAADNERLRRQVDQLNDETASLRNGQIGEIRTRDWALLVLMTQAGIDRLELPGTGGWDSRIEAGTTIHVHHRDFDRQVVITRSHPSQPGSVRFEVDVRRIEEAPTNGD